jgi:DHA2 family multidrug resistance protein
MVVGAVLFSSIQLIPQLLQEVFGYTPTLSGLALMPGGFAMLCLMPISGALAGHVPAKYLIALGLCTVALAMWRFTSLTPDANFGYFAWERAFQTIGLPFLFIPISTTAYDGLRPEQTNQASALVNVARNIGGSVGVSLATTELAQRLQFHQARLVEHTIPSLMPYQQAARHFGEQVHGSVQSGNVAVGALGQMIMKQASILAYIDVFWATGLFVLCAIPLAFLLRSTKGGATSH